MVQNDAAQAVMGNHEFNAIAFHTPRTDDPDAYYREHSAKNIQQHQATLDQFPAADLADALEWFRHLPIALDPGPLRVVHACWDQPRIELLNQRLAQGARFDANFLQDAVDRNHPLRIAVDRVLKGPEVRLPDNASIADKDGHVRRNVRIRWYQRADGHSLGAYALPSRNELTDLAVPDNAEPSVYTRDAPPVFFGHYWLNSETPSPLTDNVACLDYSVAKGGMLCAYRFDGEFRLTSERFVTVAAKTADMSRDR